MKRFLLIVSVLMISVNAFAQKQQGYEKTIEGFATIGMGEVSNTSFGIAMINGYRLNEQIFIGLGVGIGYANEVWSVEKVDNYTNVKKGESYPVPIFINGKYSLSTSKIAPYVSANVGYTLDINEYIKDAPGLMIEPAFGFDFNLNDTQFAYVQLGLNIQHGEYYYQKDVYDILGDWEIGTKEEMFKALSIRIGFSF